MGSKIYHARVGGVANTDRTGATAAGMYSFIPAADYTRRLVSIRSHAEETTTANSANIFIKGVAGTPRIWDTISVGAATAGAAAIWKDKIEYVNETIPAGVEFSISIYTDEDINFYATVDDPKAP